MVKEKAGVGHKLTRATASDAQTLSTEIFEPMSRKGRHKRSKIPRSISPLASNGLAAQPLQESLEEATEGHRVTEDSSDTEMVAPASSPITIRPRPQAPALNFMPPPALEPPHVPASASESTPRPAESSKDRALDDASVPPVDLDAHFFESSPDMPFEAETRDPHRARKLSATAAKRRAHLAKYVTVAVALSSALCVAALVKIAVARNHEDARPRPSTEAQALAIAAPLNAPTTTEPGESPLAAANSAPTDIAATAAPSAEAPAPADPPAQAAQAAQANAAPPSTAAGEQAPAQPPSSASSAPAQDPPGAVVAAGSPDDGAHAASPEPLDPKEAVKEAGKEKSKCRTLLERGKFSDAIAAGEQSISLDPTDSEAWLLLGAAYQQKGDSKNAVRSFRSCVDQGKRGPKGDCAAMLR